MGRRRVEINQGGVGEEKTAPLVGDVSEYGESYEEGTEGREADKK